MKIRNINFFEQHAEKIAIGVTGLILALAVYHYLLGDPHTVTISGQQAGPSEVDRIIKQEADRLDAKLRGETPEELAQITVPSYLADFTGRRSEQLLPDTRLATPLGGRPLFEGEDPVPGTRAPFHIPNVPTPPIIAARAEVGTIAGAELEDNRELANLYGGRDSDDSPDATWVSLVGEFDVLGLVNELSHYENGVSRRVPETWWREDLAIVEVQVERQELQEDGSWGSPEPVRPLPGEEGVGDLSGEISAAEAEEILDDVHARQLDIIQRPFFSLLNRDWAPPTAENAEELDLERIAELREEIEDLEGRRERYERVVEEMQENASRARSQPRQQRPRRSSGGGGGGPPGAGMRQQYEQQQQQQQRPQNRSNPQLERATERLRETIEELYENQVELADLTGQEAPDRPRMPNVNVSAGSSGPPGGAGGMREMMEQMTQQNQSGGPPEGIPSMREMMAQTTGQAGDGGFGNANTRRRGTSSRFERPEIEEELSDDLVRYRLDYFGAIPTEAIRERYVDLWVHDMHVEEGKTYRYRMRVAISNPLFNRDSSLPEAQREEYNDRFLLYSDWSDWSEPQEVEPLSHFFFVDGSSNPAPGHVDAEIWRFTQGRWFQEDFRLVPGDSIGHVVTVEDEEEETVYEVDFFTDAYVVDIDFDHPVVGSNRSTQRVLYAVDGEQRSEDVGARVVEQDRNILKRQWLQLQLEIGPDALTQR